MTLALFGQGARGVRGRQRDAQEVPSRADPGCALPAVPPQQNSGMYTPELLAALKELNDTAVAGEDDSENKNE